VPAIAGCSIDPSQHLSCSFGDLRPGEGVCVHVMAPTIGSTCGSFASTPIAGGTNGPIGAVTDTAAAFVAPIGDANGDCAVGVADVFRLISFLFAGGPSPL
jgi:hypothetical protein